LSVISDGYETWSLTLREENKLRVLRDGVLRKVFGPKGELVTGRYIKLLYDEPHDLHCSLNIVQAIQLSRK
jgi:hypothetical protein